MKTTRPHRVGAWLPSDQKTLERWLSRHIMEAESAAKPFHPVIRELQDFIEADAEAFMLFSLMFEQVPRKPPYNKDPTGKPQVRDYKQMLRLINHVMTMAPRFDKTALVGFPINAILDWSMGTAAGYAAFLSPRINRRLKKVLDEWGRFLASADSRYVLDADPRSGWFGKDAMSAMPHFDEEFQCAPAEPYRGFASWDDFFTRRFRAGVRPVTGRDDPSVVVNACESAPYKLSSGIQERDRFWIKAQPYSLAHIFDHDACTELFVGGTIYQAFLSALSYHRWHSPVAGKVVKAYVVGGTYYSEALSEGFDPAGPNDSQGYITEVAARALIFIEADNPDIGLMCFVGVGMAEVSTCQITVYEGQHVDKGQEIGMFHFGGSTHCLVFRRGVNLTFDLHGQQPGLDATNIPMNARIATVKPARPRRGKR